MSVSDLKISGTERKLQSSLWDEAQYWIDTDISDKPTFELFRMKKFLLYCKNQRVVFFAALTAVCQKCTVPCSRRAQF